MTRTSLMVLLALNLFVMGSSLYLMWHRWQKNVSHKSATSPVATTPAQPITETQKQPVAPVSSALQESIPQEKTADKMETAAQKSETKGSAKRNRKLSAKRKIVFQYRDSIPQRVSIIGDFNQWSPQLMKKGEGHLWSITLELEPGSYAYNFVVDGRVIRDPNNKKTKQANQKILSSFLVLQSPKTSK